MKKLLTIVGLICCSIGLLYLFFIKGQQIGIQASEFLPENVLLYTELHDFTAISKDFMESRLGKTLQGINFPEVSRELGAPPEQIEIVESFFRKAGAFIKSHAVKELLGQEFSVALFPAKSFSTENPASAIEERLILIARPRHNVHFLHFLTSLLSDEVEQSTVQYGNHSITRYRSKDIENVSEVTVQGIVLIALDERLIRKSLDCYDEKTNTLQSNKEFQQLRKRLELSKLFAYISFPALYEQGKVISEKLSASEKNDFLSLLDQWRGWRGAAYGVWKEKNLLQEKALIRYDLQELDPRIVELCSVQPSKNDTLSMVPADVLFYYWTNTLNLPLIWEIYSSFIVKQSGDMDLLHQEIRDVAGMEFEKILDMIGKDVALLIQDVDSNGIPLPKASLVVKLNNQKEFHEVFDKLLAAADIPVSEEEYNDAVISYWGLAPQEGLQPAFTFYGEYVFISNSIDVIKEIIDLQTDAKGSFLYNTNVQQVASSLNLESNSTAYVDIAALADALKDFALWAGSMASLQGAEAARSSKVVVDQVILPLLDGIAMCSKLGSRSIVETDTIVLESTISIIQ